MGIDISEAAPKQLVLAGEMQNFDIGGDARPRQIPQCAQHDFSLTQIARSEFTDDERVDQDGSGLEQCG